MFYGLTDLISLHWIIINTIIFGIIYQCVIRYWSYFSDRGLKFVRGLPILGTNYKLILGQRPLTYAFEDIYNAHPNESVIGMYELFGSPTYIVRDPELMKQIAIKDFDHFVNHRIEISDKSDPLLGRSLFLMRDQKWKDMRSTLSPAFTGSKMRLMLDLITECADEYCEFLKNEIGSRTVIYDAKDIFQRFASDTIASCAFGKKVNSLQNRHNDFYETGSSITNFGGIMALKFFGYMGIPKIMNFFQVRLFNDKVSNYLRNMVHSNIKYREENNIFRPDMINLLMEARKGKLEHSAEFDEDVGFATVHESDVGKGKKLQKWEDDDLTAQCLLFFLAGFTAVSGSQCFMAHELAINPEIQDKLYQEIQDVCNQLDGKKLSYEVLQKMTYMDMVVSETLRRWSLNPASDRVVSKPYILDDGNGKKIQLNAGDGLWMLTAAVHMDPQYYPNPETFDPERFSDENKQDIRSGCLQIDRTSSLSDAYCFVAYKIVESRVDTINDIFLSLLKSEFKQDASVNEKIGLFLFTQYCGPGERIWKTISGQGKLPISMNTYADIDVCCKRHDECPNFILNDIDYERFNGLPRRSQLFARLQCSCDAEFFSCLNDLSTQYASTVAFGYGLVQSSCFDLNYPIISCNKYSNSLLLRRCIEYRVDNTKDKTWQWFDVPPANLKLYDFPPTITD